MSFLTAVLVAALAAYGGLVALLFAAQEAMIFPRHAVRPAPAGPPARSERLELRTAEGHRLVGMLVRAEPAGGAGRGLLLGFAGNAWNAEDFAAFLAQRLPGLDVAVFHYRGYAPSEGRPGEAALRADAAAAYDHLARRLRPARTLAAGFSLGSGVAAALARDRPLDGLLLVTPFDSIEAVARARYPWAPVGRLLRHRFRSDLRLAGLDVPAAVIAAGDDRIVPARHAEALVRALRRPVLVETVPGVGHGGIYRTEAFDDALRRAVDALERAAPARPG